MIGSLKKIWSMSPLGFMVYTRKFIFGEKKIKYQGRFVQFNIKEGEKVLDIGSGGEPFPYATHLLDKFPEKTHHRYNKLETGKLPFTQGDVKNLPFQDQSFDFIYCAHVIEHVENPDKACDEIMRVGKRGYIEVPTRMSDIMFNFSSMNHFHKWHIIQAGDALIFVEYNKFEQVDTGSKEFFYMTHSLLPNSMKNLYRKHKNLFSNMFLWDRHFTYYVFDKLGKLIACNSK